MYKHNLTELFHLIFSRIHRYLLGYRWFVAYTNVDLLGYQVQEWATWRKTEWTITEARVIAQQLGGRLQMQVLVLKESTENLLQFGLILWFLTWLYRKDRANRPAEHMLSCMFLFQLPIMFFRCPACLGARLRIGCGFESRQRQFKYIQICIPGRAGVVSVNNTQSGLTSKIQLKRTNRSVCQHCLTAICDFRDRYFLQLCHVTEYRKDCESRKYTRTAVPNGYN